MCQHLLSDLIDPIDVGPLLAVHFDVDEQLVQRLRGVRILEGFVRHHVTPVTRRIADAQMNRFLLGSRTLERRRTPRIPFDGVVRVLQQVGTGLRDEMIGKSRPVRVGCACHCSRARVIGWS